MSLLTELFYEARSEVLQEDWDKCLLSAWRSSKFLRTESVVGKFRDAYQLTKEEFSKLRRVPYFSNQFKTRIPRFVAAYLPDLNEKLFGSNLCDEDLLVFMRNLETLHRPFDHRNSTEDFRVRKSGSDTDSANRLSAKMSSSKNFAHSRRWETVKPVRSK